MGVGISKAIGPESSFQSELSKSNMMMIPPITVGHNNYNALIQNANFMQMQSANLAISSQGPYLNQQVMPMMPDQVPAAPLNAISQQIQLA